MDLFEIVFEHAPDAILVVDRDGHILHANQRVFAIFGYHPCELVGRSTDFVLEQPLPATGTFHGSARRRDGTPAPIDAVIGCAPIDDGSVRIAYVRERRAGLSQAVEAQRHELAAWAGAQFAHEVNNALQIIMTNVDMIPPQSERVAKKVADIREATTRTIKLARSLLAAARPSDQCEVDVVAFIRDTHRLLEQLAPGYEISIAADIRTPHVLASVSELLQVMMNLVLNARDAMPVGSRIAIEVGPRANHAAIAVRDQGPGISPELKERVFEPFFSTKSPGCGTGLGLWISRDVVERHGGTIEVTDNEPQGTVFTILLPAR